MPTSAKKKTLDKFCTKFGNLLDKIPHVYSKFGVNLNLILFSPGRFLFHDVAMLRDMVAASLFDQSAINQQFLDTLLHFAKQLMMKNWCKSITDQ